jgi:hypothetical protein
MVGQPAGRKRAQRKRSIGPAQAVPGQPTLEWQVMGEPDGAPEAILFAALAS